jgi:hypothetical protein
MSPVNEKRSDQFVVLQEAHRTMVQFAAQRSNRHSEEWRFFFLSDILKI